MSACTRVIGCLCSVQPVGVSPLHIAAHVGNESVCQWLLEQGKLRVHSLDKVGTPHPPVETGPFTGVPSLLQFGQTPLHYAAAKGHIDAIKRLRFHHGDVFFRSKVGHAHATPTCRLMR